MSGRGWAILTVRRAISEGARELAHNMGLTVEELQIS